MVHYKLTYFNKRGGGEIIRLIFAAANQEYEDERLTDEQWQNRKPDTPMRNLPLLTVDGKTMCQSGSIARYLARELGLAGNNSWDEFRIDEIYDTIGDVRRAFMKIRFEKDSAKKGEFQKDFNDYVIGVQFREFFKLRVQDNSKENPGGYLVGNKLTLADIVVFNTLNALQVLVPGYWGRFPEIQEFHDNIAREPGIAEWLAKRPVTDI